jgi:hypothetical protein
VLLQDRINDILRLVVAQGRKVVSDVGDVIPTGIVRFARVHRVVRSSISHVSIKQRA